MHINKEKITIAFENFKQKKSFYTFIFWQEIKIETNNISNEKYFRNIQKLNNFIYFFIYFIKRI